MYIYVYREHQSNPEIHILMHLIHQSMNDHKKSKDKKDFCLFDFNFFVTSEPFLIFNHSSFSDSFGMNALDLHVSLSIGIL